MSLANVAAPCGVTPQAVWNWEHGKAMPRWPHITTMAGLYGVSAGVLLGEPVA